MTNKLTDQEFVDKFNGNMPKGWSSEDMVHTILRNCDHGELMYIAQNIDELTQRLYIALDERGFRL